MATTKKLVPIMFTFLASIILIIEIIISKEITCTTTNHCRDDPIQCTPNEYCTVECRGSNESNLIFNDEPCLNTVIHCTDDYPCTVNCSGRGACWGMKIYCPNNTECNVIAPYGDRAMTWAQIYGGYNGILNVRNDANYGLELGSIICPTNGECNIYSKNLLNVASSVYMNTIFNASSSNTLSISIEGYDEPLIFSKIYCPMTSMRTTPNCMIHVSDGGNINIDDLFYHTRIYTNQYTDLYIHVDAISYSKCTVELQLNCIEYQGICNAILVNGTNDEWHCINTSKQTHCPTLNPTTTIPTTAIPITAMHSTLYRSISKGNGILGNTKWYLWIGVVLLCCFVILLLLFIYLYNRRSDKDKKANQINIVDEQVVNNTVPVFEEPNAAVPNDQEMVERTASIETVRLWMKNEVNLSEYTELLIMNGYDDMPSLMEITLENLVQMGIQKVGHRQKIFKFVSMLVAQQGNDRDTTKCVDCDQIKPGKIYDRDGLFYCHQCYMNYVNDNQEGEQSSSNNGELGDSDDMYVDHDLHNEPKKWDANEQDIVETTKRDEAQNEGKDKNTKNDDYYDKHYDYIWRQEFK